MNHYKVMEDWNGGRSFYFDSFREACAKAKEIVRIERLHMSKSDYERDPRASVLVMFSAGSLWGVMAEYPLASADMIRRWKTK